MKPAGTSLAVPGKFFKASHLREKIIEARKPLPELDEVDDYEEDED